jgi:hypothetical protein
MGRAKALAFISRMFDVAQAGAVVWDEVELIRRFIGACSRTGSDETRSGYRQELRHLSQWRDVHHPPLELRLMDPSIVVSNPAESSSLNWADLS